MTPAQVQELLELRRHATGEQFDANGAKRDAWHDVLADYDAATVMRRYRELVRAGTEKISLPTLLGGLQRSDDPTQLPRRVNADDCTHDAATPNGAESWRCPTCRAELLAGTHPRAIAAFERGLAEERARRAARGAA